VSEASDPVFHVLNQPALTSTLRAAGITESGQHIVYVGGFGPHKNLDMLVKTFAKIINQKQFSDARLVLVGEFKKEVFYSYFQEIKDLILKLGLDSNVIFTGYLSDEDLVILLNRATVSVLPSLMEGFGLPAVEAAACGCPVIATKESPLPQLLGDSGIYIDPANPYDLETALERVLASDTLRQQMRAAGIAAAGQLTWDAAAQQLINVIQMVSLQ
jgi:glycosyltransferase involved in cell wall biosynthesis